MSETKKTVQDLQTEYTKLCTKAGHLAYQVNALTGELNTVYDTLKTINLEAAALDAAAKEEAVKASEEKANESQS